MRLLLCFLSSTWLFLLTNALHFYLDANEKRCFIEEIPSDTVVEGTYKALEWIEARQVYAVNSELGITIQVEEVVDGDIVVKVRQRPLRCILGDTDLVHHQTVGPPEGKFTFTSHAAGDHSICLSTNYTSWFSSTHIRCVYNPASA